MERREITVSTWDRVWSLYLEFQKSTDPWVFRGQPNADDHLTTSLERVAKRFGIELRELRELEPELIRHFKRQAHHYVINLPKDDDTIGWLALMRHYGAPTRLIDWSYSFFVALYFAVEEADKNCAVWALDFNWMRKKAEPRFRKKVRRLLRTDPRLKSGEFFERVFNKRPPFNLVYSLNPDRLNERLIIQQGFFLAPGNITKPFEENFDTLQKTDPDPRKHLLKITIRTPVSLKKESLRHLQRMNINRATLFPGLGGFSKSLRSLLANPDILRGRYPFT